MSTTTFRPRSKARRQRPFLRFRSSPPEAQRPPAGKTRILLADGRAVLVPFAHGPYIAGLAGMDEASWIGLEKLNGEIVFVRAGQVVGAEAA